MTIGHSYLIKTCQFLFSQNPSQIRIYTLLYSLKRTHWKNVSSSSSFASFLFFILTNVRLSIKICVHFLCSSSFSQTQKSIFESEGKSLLLFLFIIKLQTSNFHKPPTILLLCSCSSSFFKTVWNQRHLVLFIFKTHELRYYFSF